MSLLFADSFDHYSDAQILRKYDARLNSGSGTNYGVGAGGRNSTSGYVFTIVDAPANSYLKKAFASAPATMFVGFALKLTALPSGERRICTFVEAGTVHVEIQLMSDGRFRAYRNGTLLGTSTAAISASQFNYIEIKVVISDTVGEVVLKINAVTALNLTSQDTRNAGSGNISEFYFLGSPTTATSLAQAQFDDFYVLDSAGGTNNSYLGDVRVQAILPTGAGNYTQWTPSAGSNWQNVDENPATDDTDYNSSSTVGQKDSFVFADITPTAGTVYGVCVNLVTRKDDAGVRTIRALARLSATDGFGSNMNIGTSYANYQSILETKPSGGAWSISDVNNSEYGYECVA